MGEDIAETYLKNKGFLILERNYRVGKGEIDIIAQKRKPLDLAQGKLIFVEVKAILKRFENQFRPEENLTKSKLNHLRVSVSQYLRDKKLPPETRWQLDIIAIDLLLNDKYEIRHLENVII